MFICSELSDTNTCLEWVDVSTLLSIESGVGFQFGMMLLGVAIVAWCMREVAMLILNR